MEQLSLSTSPAFSCKHRRRPGLVKRHSPGDKRLAASWDGTGSITKDCGEGDGLDGTHFVVAVDGEEPQLPIVEFNLPFHITRGYTAAGKGKLLTNTLTAPKYFLESILGWK